jgi:single-strand selective monofunctional uracil DNA glycosylase
MTKTAEALKDAARALAARVDALAFAPPVSHVYDPLDYAWPMHAQYIDRFGSSKKRVVLLGMNPGPYGMAQTGIPFGEVRLVRDWLKLDAPIAHPKREHEKRPVLGLACTRSEVSGARLWGAVAKAHPDPKTFFKEHFVVNYCPLLFLDEGARNLTPDKLPKVERAPLEAACDAHLGALVKALSPEVVIGVGGFAQKCAARVVGSAARVAQIPHPSPASPAANAGWERIAREALDAAGVPRFL